ncbi:Cytoplasmic phosphatidylinositol transfer protein 1-like isoform X1 [Oopsacas minuta]|uniref:Cytoplasmic phosphatidylinositol transfer protein 1-like isoform X1 n=1 Tax=Oopsacas minuta TaxID=111878 RepID=A0AAV7KGT8_9METZ|nr:Cytoplasmic phosphatidylinositol transfer protein 1-like isoform X1 [Oopsacas minuta]
MLIREFRIVMPLSVDEFQRGQRYTIAKAEREAVEEGVGIMLVVSEHCQHDLYGDGVHQVKRFYLTSYLPSWVQSFIPSHSFYVLEESWNYYPYHCYSIFTCKILPNLRVEIFSCYLNDKGTTDNVFKLDPVVLKQSKVVVFDVINDRLKDNKGGRYNTEVFKCEKAKRGPLNKDWIDTQNEVMCSYKLIKSSVPIIGIQNKAECGIVEGLREVLYQTHKDSIMWLDEWFDITYGELRELELLLINQTTQHAKTMNGNDDVIVKIDRIAVVDSVTDSDDEFQDAQTDL